MTKKVDASDHFIIKKETVDFIVVLLLGNIPQPLIAYLVMRFTDNQWGSFWWTILAINVFYFVMWLLNTIATAITFKLYFFKRLSDRVYNQLAHFKFPTITESALQYSDAESIYYEIANEMDYLPCIIRIRATSFYCEFTMACSGIIANTRLNKVHIAALKRYTEDYPDVIYSETDINTAQDAIDAIIKLEPSPEPQ
jgi:hypothetical protein